jgi:EAL domain-containing protein (putative c-di-GMP-specific phosphodiesterase class I)
VTTDVVLVEGDIVHVADLEFVVARASRQELEELMGVTAEIDLGLPEPMVGHVRSLRELLNTGSVRTVFQPIVSLEDGAVLGYEMLGRADLEGLPDGAYELFNIAASTGAEAELSRLFRQVCLESCDELPGDPVVFFNTHPAELSDPRLIKSLRAVRERLPDRKLVLEIHEVAITEQRMIRRLRSRLSELDIGLAYDDFGTGQARLVDVVEVPPDYLKFDISLVRGVDRLSSKQRMVESLVRMALDMGIAPTAEGIETEGEAEICSKLGFQYAQGFYFGRPVRIEELRLAG